MSNIGMPHISQQTLRGCGSAVNSTDAAQPWSIPYWIWTLISSSVKSGRYENVPCVIRKPVRTISLLPLTFSQLVAAFVPRLDHRLDRHAVGGGTRGDTHRMADGPATELKDDVFAQVMQKLMHLPCVDSAGGHRHDTRQVDPILVEIDPGHWV